jgi:hypothetical protein
MKRRDVMKLRKKVANFKEYEVSYSLGLFGNFYDGGLCCETVKASNPKEAVERYLRWYFRYYKCRNEFHTNNLVETSYNWGRFMVIDSKGYKRYFM